MVSTKFDFLIPVSRDDLLNKTDVTQYVVDEVLLLREIPGAIQDAKVALKNKGPLCILEHFDAFFSLLCTMKDIDAELKEEAWEILLKFTTALTNHMASVLEEGDFDKETRIDSLNCVKMTCYLLCQYIEMLENDDTKPNTSQIVNAKGKGKKKKDTGAWTLDWAKEKEHGIKAVLHLVQLNIHRLWDPPIPEEEFVSLVTNCCYKLLENPSIAYVASKEAREGIAHILGVMVKRYNHGLGVSLKVIQLLQHFEHLVTPLAEAVVLFVSEYGAKNVIAELFREIGRMDPADLARDTSGTRAYSTFIVEVAEKISAAVLPNISLILCHLDAESHSMRNGILGVMGEIHIKILSQENLDDKLKTARDQFLDKLEDHIHDTAAFVRSKVLQIWLNIVNEKCLPLNRQGSLLHLVLGRLQDKSSQVRKSAIQLITNLLKSNPFAAKLSAEELKVSYETEKKKLDEMMPEHLTQDATNESFKNKICEEWKALQKRLMVILSLEGSEEEIVGEESENKEGDSELIAEEDTVESVLDKIFVYITEEKYKKAMKLMTAAKESWPDLGESNSQSEGDDGVFEEDGLSKNQMMIIKSLKRLYFARKRTSLASVTEALEMHGTQDQNIVNELSKQQVLVQYLQDSLAFATLIQEAIPIISQLLGSKTTSDILEAVEFFVTGYEFGLTASIVGIKKMLLLVSSKEPGIKEAVVAAYRRLYLSPEGGNERSRALTVVKSLSCLIDDATLGELTALEGLIVELVKSGEISSTIIQMLWERFTMKVPNTTEGNSRAAVVLLAMVAGANMSVIKSNIDVLVKEGLGIRAETDFLLGRDTCLALMKLGVPKAMKGAVGNEPFRLPESHDLFQRLKLILTNGITNLENRYWIPLAEQAVNVIYKLGEHADLICNDIIKQIIHQVLKASNSTESGDSMQADGAGDGAKSCPSGLLVRLISIVGHVALKQVIHLDVAVFGELKRRRAFQEDKAKVKDTRRSASDATKPKESSAENIEEELGLAGAAAEDAESEYIRKICEYEVVTGSTLLSAFRPLLIEVSTNQSKYTDPELRTAATLALSKFMLVSSQFCEAHLQILFTILEKSPHPVIRANTIIALGDMAFRFPNLIEPWTPYLYARLRDESSQVRKNTIQVLTHLILNDMIKVKGQISEMATCIIDHDERISNLAKLFFHELAKKGNAVYNIMPDMVSRLSDPDIGVDEENFRTIMKYLFSFIQKEKHCESLVEKLCHRYRATKVDRQWRDLSYCLSMLSYSEKCLRKLQENFACFGDKLADEEVYSCFCTIINKSRSFVKQEAKAVIDELERLIEQCHNKGLEDAEASGRAMSDFAAAASKRHKTPRKPSKTLAHGGRKGRRGRKDNDSDEENIDENMTPLPRTQRARAAKQKPRPIFDSDEDSDIELFQVDKSSKDSKKLEKPVDSESEDSEPLSPRQKPQKGRGKRQKRRLSSLQSPLQLSNSPV
ncbi:hypothetical protein CHS0354_017179 [Potamilus streckersoni]|uniref:Condensin complex subunit 1 n=1 Tax=Potamilus streckersoni TaxID=2493646 RepID=A0AAE0T3L1_9BIVA|nr:hypothetical protein CHS0354_017179 [Potamilus streckersoni]